MDSWQDRYRLMLEHASDVVFTATPDGRLEWVSPSIRKLTGVPPDQLIGLPITGFIHEPDRPQLRERFQAVLQGGEVEFVGRVIRTDLEPHWVSATAAPLRDGNGTMIGIVGSVRDVHEAMEARREAAVADESYRLLAEHMTDVVFRMDPSLHILWVSPSVSKVLGYVPAELVGRSISSLVFEDDWVAMQQVREGTLVRARTARDELVWVSSRPSPVLDAQGHLTGLVATWNDVQDLVRAREEAERQHVRLRATLDAQLDPHVLLQVVRDGNGQIVDFVHIEANQAACAFMRDEPEPLVGVRLSDAMPRAVFPEWLALLAGVAESGATLSIDDYLPADADPAGPLYLDLRAVAVTVGESVSHTWRDVTDRHRFEERLAHLASHDPLTGLANRASLIDEIGRGLSAAARSARSVGVIMLDLDHFKNVNDSLGHSVGDELLLAASRRIESSVRGGDLVCRLGGDEFVVVMRDLEDSSEALRVALRIVEAFRESIAVEGHDLQTTASVGVAISTPRSEAEALLDEADAAMYCAKDDGRDRVSLYNEDLRVAATARVALEAQLRPALGLGELAVHYQPEVDLFTGEVCAVEALLRWHHPSGELYSAARFIDIAEEIGVIVESGNWVVREACAQAAAWAAAAPERRLQMRLNLSKQQLTEARLVYAFEAALLRSGIDASMISAEVSEAALMLSSATVQHNLAGLRAMGVRLAIDNFGTGYAALAYLRDQQVDMVKIDRSYVREIECDDYSRRLVGGIVALARSIGLQVAAEGVETLEQARILRDLGCTTAQGFLFMPAQPPDVVEPYLGRRFQVS